MDILLYISAIIAALAFLLIAVFVVITLKSTKQTMSEVSETLKRVETKVSGVATKAESLVDKTNQITQNAEQKLEAFDNLSKAAQKLDDTTNDLQASFQNVAKQISTPPVKQGKMVEQASVLTETISRIYFTLKKNRK